MTLASSIGKAEELYYMANGEYAKDIDKLDLNFPGERVNYYVNSLQTKHFACRPVGGPWQETEVQAVCNRLPKETVYAVVWLKGGGWLAGGITKRENRIAKCSAPLRAAKCVCSKKYPPGIAGGSLDNKNPRSYFAPGISL